MGVLQPICLRVALLLLGDFFLFFFYIIIILKGGGVGGGAGTGYKGRAPRSSRHFPATMSAPLA